jgi:hypothetical protein
MMKRMKLLPMLGVLGCLGLSTVLARAQGPAADPAAATEGQPVPASAAQPSVAQRANRLPVFNLRTQGQWTIDQLVREVRAQVAKDKTGTQTVNIVMGPGVGELKAPADLELVNVTPLGVFAAIASVEPQLNFAPVSTPGSDLTIALQLRPGARERRGGEGIKLRAFRLPPIPKLQGADEATIHKHQVDALRMLQKNIQELMGTAAGLRAEATGRGTSQGFQFQVHIETRTVLVTGGAEDLDLAQEVLTALGATPSSSGRMDDPNATKPSQAF